MMGRYPMSPAAAEALGEGVRMLSRWIWKHVRPGGVHAYERRPWAEGPWADVVYCRSHKKRGLWAAFVRLCTDDLYGWKWDWQIVPPERRDP